SLRTASLRKERRRSLFQARAKAGDGSVHGEVGIFRITFEPNQLGGRPCIRGMRIRGTVVPELLAARDRSTGSGTVTGLPVGSFEGSSAGTTPCRRSEHRR